jgi:hypothetical protein
MLPLGLRSKISPKGSKCQGRGMEYVPETIVRPGSDDRLRGSDDRLPGSDDRLPGSDDRLPGSDGWLPGSTRTVDRPTQTRVRA